MDHAIAKRQQVLDALNDTSRLAQQGGLLVGQVMTGRPSCITPDMSALQLIHLFHAKQFRHLLVLDEESVLIGVISDRDVIRCLGPDKHPEPSVLDGIAARDIMSTDLITVTPGTSLERAVTLMINHGISCLPVQIDSTLVGILTNTDLNVILQTLLQTTSWLPSVQSIATAQLDPHN
ncbi:MAG: CBS domain-containing protein [Pirellulales bacterium]|nr:CBS domain-containing protein [Pirellulales bacterium]